MSPKVTYVDIVGFPLDGLDDVPADLDEVVPGAPHGPGKVHKEVEVDGKVFGVPDLEGDVNRSARSKNEGGSQMLIWLKKKKKKKTVQSSCSMENINMKGGHQHELVKF